MQVRDDDLVTIDHFSSIADAEVARATLEGAGIDAALGDENIARLYWGHAQMHGRVRLQVRRCDAGAAAEVLREAQTRADDRWDDDAWSSRAPTDRHESCLRCGSEEVYPAESRAKSYARALAFSILGAMFLNLGSCVATLLGAELPRQLLSWLLVIALITPFAVALISAVAGKKECRNCHARWRGAQRPS